MIEIEGNGYRLCILHKLKLDDVLDEDVDLHVYLDDGRHYVCTLCTPENLRALLDKWRVSGEGVCVWDPSLVVVPDMQIDSIRAAVEELIEEEEIGKAMEVACNSPEYMANELRELPPEEAHESCHWALPPRGEPQLTPSHAAELLAVARGVEQWHKSMVALMIGHLRFDNEFVDYAIDMLTLPPSGMPSKEQVQRCLAKDENPWAVSVWAFNLLVSRESITPLQYERIAQLPDDTLGKQTLLDTLKSRVSA